MKALSELFDETRLLVPCYPRGNATGEIALDGHNLSVIPLSSRRGSGLTAKLSFLPWFPLNSSAIFGELWRADAVHAPIPGDVGTAGMLLAWVFRKPLFVRYCGNWLKVKTTAERFWHWFMEATANKRNLMLATGGTAHPPSARTPHVRWIFSTSLTESEIIELAAGKITLEAEKLRLIIVGRQEAGKGTELLIQALPLIHRQFPHCSLDVVGDGAAMPLLQRRAAALGIVERVTFHGRVNHAEVIRLLQHAHVFCFPTQSEGFPKAVLEALACGLPVLATPVSVLPALLSNGCGILIESGPAAIAKAVCDLASSPAAYQLMSAKARDTARQYTLEHWRDTIGGYLTAAWGPLKTRDEGGNLKLKKPAVVQAVVGSQEVDT